MENHHRYDFGVGFSSFATFTYQVFVTIPRQPITNNTQSIQFYRQKFQGAQKNYLNRKNERCDGTKSKF